MPTLTTNRALVMAAALALSTVACSSNPILPFEPEITSATDNFQFQATGLADITTTQTYSWNNTGTQATINHSTVTTAGSAHLTVRDEAGAVVYSKLLEPSLSEATAVGSPGTWTIVLTLTGYSGTLNFRAQKL